MRIAMIGVKGIPAKWGGMEKYVEEIGSRLVQRGHEVTVFGSRWYCANYKEDYYKGIRIRRMPTIHSQAADALSNAFMAAISIILGNYDIVHFHGYASYYFVIPLRLLGHKTVVTTHGLADAEWANPKYGKLGHFIIRLAGGIGIRHANRISTVARYWQKTIREKFRIDPEVLPGGLDEPVQLPARIINDKYGLTSGDYILFLGRIDPIKRVDWVTRLSLTDNAIKLVIAGGTQDESTRGYLEGIITEASGNDQVIFTGPVFGDEKSELLSNCKFLVNPSSSEGLPITVLEAMSYGRCCVASNIPAHKEIIDDGLTGFLFDWKSMEDFQLKVKDVSMLSAFALKTIGLRAKLQTASQYDWDRTAQLTEDVYKGLINDQKR